MSRFAKHILSAAIKGRPSGRPLVFRVTGSAVAARIARVCEFDCDIDHSASTNLCSAILLKI
jgi:hypothetical protein